MRLSMQLTSPLRQDVTRPDPSAARPLTLAPVHRYSARHLRNGKTEKRKDGNSQQKGEEEDNKLENQRKELEYDTGLEKELNGKDVDRIVTPLVYKNCPSRVTNTRSGRLIISSGSL